MDLPPKLMKIQFVVFLVDKSNNFLGSKISKYTTRVKGWEGRMKGIIRKLILLRNEAGNDNIGNPVPVWKCKKEGPNKGRFFVEKPTFRFLT